MSNVASEMCFAFDETGSQEADAIFFELPTIAADGSTGAGRSSKTCRDVPNVFRAAGCKRESRLANPLVLGIPMG